MDLKSHVWWTCGRVGDPREELPLKNVWRENVQWKRDATSRFLTLFLLKPILRVIPLTFKADQRGGKAEPKKGIVCHLCRETMTL